jgi:cell wall assembly regulator SMI1
MFLIADHSPTHEGTAGQIIAFIHDEDEVVFLSSSLSEFLQGSIETLEACRDEIFI